jgi:hypothetical protein
MAIVLSAPGPVFQTDARTSVILKLLHDFLRGRDNTLSGIILRRMYLRLVF